MTAKDLDWVIQRMLQMNIGYGKFTLEDASISKPGQALDDYTYQLTLDTANPAALPVLAREGLAPPGQLENLQAFFETAGSARAGNSISFELFRPPITAKNEPDVMAPLDC
jgi:ABC-type transport system substrate-binding protein